MQAPAPVPQYQEMNFAEEVDSPMLSDPSTELHELSASGMHLRRNPESIAPPAHYIPALPIRGSPSMNHAMAFNAATRGRTLARNHDARPRRPTSVVKQQTTSSYLHLGLIPFEESHNFLDDTCAPGGGFKKHHTSAGRPTSGLSIPITSPMNHSHGLPFHQQIALCARNECLDSHIFDASLPFALQWQHCARYNCHPHLHDPQNSSGHPARHMAVQQDPPVDIEALMATDPQTPPPQTPFPG